MTWLSWRQQRTETVLTAVLLAVLAAVVVPAALDAASAYSHYHVGACLNYHIADPCDLRLSNFIDHLGGIQGGLGYFNVLIGLIGVALAAPLVWDLENGTTAFAWTQSVTRRRWLTARVGIAVLTAVAAAGVYTLLLGWYVNPINAAYGPFWRSDFDVQGILPLAYALFALGLGLAFGAIWRRTGPAMISAFFAYGAARLWVDRSLRPNFLTPVSHTWPPHSYPNLQQAWQIKYFASNRAGHMFDPESQPGWWHCFHGQIGTTTPDDYCDIKLGGGYTHAVYQPASRFWEFQGIEFALFAGAATLLIAFAVWRVLRAD